MNIIFTINNVASKSVDNDIIMRKFFQMVFVDNDRKGFNIYTATVLGAEDKTSKLHMDFKFDIKEDGNNEIIEIAQEDITEGKGNFIDQIDFIKRVWGNECKILYHDQEGLSEILKGNNSIDLFFNEVESLLNNKFLHIKDSAKQGNGNEFESIAICGGFESENFKRCKNNNNEQLFESSTYSITAPNIIKDLKYIENIEIVNWVKTRIRFKYKMNESNIAYTIKKKLKCMSPDFTWYFSPRVNSFIKNDSSVVEIKGSKNINNSFKVEPVPNKTTVNFRRWVNDEKIAFRQKYRIPNKHIFNDNCSFNEIDELNIYIDLSDEHSRANRQFILSLFISFALAFGIDKSRLEEIAIFFPLNHYVVPDFWWLSFLTLLSFNIMIIPPKSAPRGLLLIRRINIITSITWIAFIYLGYRSMIMHKACHFIKSIIDKFSCLIVFLFVIILLSNLGYIVYNKLKFKYSILNGLFGEEDIL